MKGCYSDQSLLPKRVSSILPLRLCSLLGQVIRCVKASFS